MKVKNKMKSYIKLFTEFGPIAVFFLMNAQYGIFHATAAFMAATAIAIPIAWKMDGKIPVMPIVVGIFVLFFGSLTLIFHDDTFIKLKPTIVNLLFASILIVSKTYFKKNILKLVLGSAFKLSEKGWNILNTRWTYFFIFLAILNEIVWRNFSTDTWVTFKLFGILPITLIWAALQMPLILKEGKEEKV